jgi:hypothetical protein
MIPESELREIESEFEDPDCMFNYGLRCTVPRKISELITEIRRLRAELAWYGMTSNDWHEQMDKMFNDDDGMESGMAHPEVLYNYGARARKALGKDE